MFIAFSYNCINPFIYATKLEPVKEVLLRMIPCKKITEEATENVAMTASTRAAGTVTWRGGRVVGYNWYEHDE